MRKKTLCVDTKLVVKNRENNSLKVRQKRTKKTLTPTLCAEAFDSDMACSYPQEVYKTIDGKISWNEKHEAHGKMLIPCGSCMQCRITNSLDWAVRCTNEMQMHEQSTFLTLTYETLPLNGSLDHKHFQAFIDKLRKNTKTKIRYFMCGEYGTNTDESIYGRSKLGRPHFHALIFGYDFPDKEIYKKSRGGDNYYTSKKLTKWWGHGHAVIANANFQTAAYISRYITKKLKGNNHHVDDHYTRWQPDGPWIDLIDEKTGEIELKVSITPEYQRQSTNRGLGYSYLIKYFTDVFPSDEIVISGRTYQVPRYYTKILKEQNEDLYDHIYSTRQLNAAHNKLISTDTRDYYKRAYDKELNAQKSLLKRIYEEELS
ncbi:replication initiator protein [Microviridae sp.]|nr:replication initiator protein [Microviridae sp.]